MIVEVIHVGLTQSTPSNPPFVVATGRPDHDLSSLLSFRSDSVSRVSKSLLILNLALKSPLLFPIATGLLSCRAYTDQRRGTATLARHNSLKSMLALPRTKTSLGVDLNQETSRNHAGHSRVIERRRQPLGRALPMTYVSDSCGSIYPSLVATTHSLRSAKSFASRNGGSSYGS